MTQTQPAAVNESFVLRCAAGLSVRQAADLCGVSPSAWKSWENGADVPEGALGPIKPLVRPPTSGGDAFRFVDLFAGIGGMRRAFEAAGGDCVMTAEWNREALKTYVANHGAGHTIVGDVTKVAAGDVPDHEILVGGFPCQPFSLAGVSKKNSLGRAHGFADATQGTLFFDVARIIAEKRPAAFLLENVRNLLSHDKGRTFEVIRRTLEDELGYAIAFRVMDGSAWVPQRRPRIFIVGFRDGPAFDFSTVDVPSGGPALGSILHAGDVDPVFAPDGFALPKYVLSDGLWRYLQDYAAKHRAAGNGFGFGLVGEGDVARTLSARYGKDGSEILIRTTSGNPRRLTPRECSRLMGFDAVGAPMVIPVSDAQAYRQFGNSVVVPCIAAIASAMRVRLEAGNAALELAA
jgi:DNA (cytosine-5)-methyltransferase 1